VFDRAFTVFMEVVIRPGGKRSMDVVAEYAARFGVRNMEGVVV